MKNLKVIIGIIIVIVFITITIMFLIRKEKPYLDNQDYLTQVIYDSSGDMRGSIYNATLNVLEKTLIVNEKDYYDDPLIIKKYKVTERDIIDIKKMITENKFPEWEKYEMDERLFAYDAASKSFSFEYEKDDLDWYHVNFNIKLTSQQRNKLNEFTKLFLSLVKEENLIEESTE